MTYAFQSPVASSGSPSNTQYVWSSTSGLSQTLQSNTFSASAAGTVTGTYKTQYDLKFAQSGLDGTAQGTVVSVTIGANSPVNVVFTDFTKNFGFVDANTNIAYTFTSTVTSSTTGKQFALTTPAPTPASGFSLSGTTTVTGNYKVQWQVTFAASPPGAGSTVPSGTNWYDNAFIINPISATPTGGYAFSSWGSSTGSIGFGSTSSASTTATIGGTGTVTANFVPTFVVPEYYFGALASLGACFIALLVYKRKSLSSLHLNIHR